MTESDEKHFRAIGQSLEQLSHAIDDFAIVASRDKPAWMVSQFIYSNALAVCNLIPAGCEEHRNKFHQRCLEQIFVLTTSDDLDPETRLPTTFFDEFCERGFSSPTQALLLGEIYCRWLSHHGDKSGIESAIKKLEPHTTPPFPKEHLEAIRISTLEDADKQRK